jgi:CHASE2 domain
MSVFVRSRSLLALFIACGGLSFVSLEATASSRFVFVNFDDASTNKFGDVPSRANVAKVLRLINEAAPRAVALKFFYDRATVDDETKQLLAEIAKGRVLLQATVNPDPPTTKFLDERFYFTGSLGGVIPEISGSEGWIPNPKISEKAQKVCFVDVITPERIPMLERFRGKPVKSLYACLLEEAFDGSLMKLEPGLARFGRYGLVIDTTASSTIKLNDLSLPKTISALEIIEGKVEKTQLYGKVVVVIYTGRKSPVATVGNAEAKIHQVFAAQLLELEAAMYLVKPRNAINH